MLSVKVRCRIFTVKSDVLKVCVLLLCFKAIILHVPAFRPHRYSLAYEGKSRSHSFYTMEIHDQSQASVCVIYGGQSSTGIRFSSSTSVEPFQYHSTNVPCTYFTHLPSVLYNLDS